MKIFIILVIAIACLFLLVNEANYVSSCCGLPPEPPPPLPEKPPPPDITEGPEKPGLTPIDPSDPSASETQPGKILPPDGQPPANPGASSKPPVTAPPPNRPRLGLGLQPLFRTMQSGSSSLSGVVEPWEVWWSRNRGKYLSFKKPIEWVKVVDEGGTKSITIYPIYEELLNILTEGLLDKNQYISFRAAISLGRADTSISPKPIEILKQAYKNETREFSRHNIILALGLLGDVPTDAITKAILRDKRDTACIRSYAALALGYIKNDPEIPKLLLEILTDKDNPEVKCCAGLALGNLKYNKAVPLLGNMLNSTGGRKETPSVRAYAALGLGRIGSKEAVNELKKCTPANEREIMIRSAVAIALGITELPEAKEPLLLFLNDKRDPTVRGLAAISLTRLKGEKPYETIASALQENKSKEAEGLFILALGFTGDAKAKADFRKILEDKKARDLTKAAAAIGSGLLKDKEAVPIITGMLKDKSGINNFIRTPYFILALGMIQDERGIEPLAKIWEMLNSSNPHLLAYHTNLGVALTMLGKRDEIVMPLLLKQINQAEDSLTRTYALHTFGLIGTKENVQVFIDTNKDKNLYVRFSTLSSIGFLLDKNQVNQLDQITSDNIDLTLGIVDHLNLIPIW